MSDVIKNALYRQRRTFNKSFSKAKTRHCKSIAKRIREQKLESSLIKSLSEKLINSVLFGSGRRRTWSCRHYSVQWRRAVAVSLPTCAKGGVTHCKHWFWVKLALITFIVTSTTGLDGSAICAIADFCFFGENFVPCWCCCGTAMRAFHFAR